MHGICTSCGGQTSTPATRRCKSCYREQLRKNYISNTGNRDSLIVDMVVNQHKSAADVAREYNLSREAIRLILIKNKIDYASIKKNRSEEKLLLKTERKSVCRWCHQEFSLPNGDRRIKYCETEHKKLQQMIDQRRRTKKHSTRILDSLNKSPEVSLL